MDVFPRIAIVFPYHRSKSPTELLLPPLGAAALAAQLRRLRMEVRIFDCTFLTPGQSFRGVTDYRPDIVGIYSMITLTRNAFRMANEIRRRLPESLIVAGGPMPTLYPEKYRQPFDAVFRGESDLSFPHFCRDAVHQDGSRLRLGELSLTDYPGLVIQNDDLRIDNPLVHYREDEMDTFPIPDRREFNHAGYQEFWLRKNGTKTTSLMTTFGCPFRCDFCSRPVFGNVYRRRIMDSLIEEIEQIRRLGYDSLWIADDNFTLNLRHLNDFCNQMTGRKLNWSCLSRSDGIDVDTIRHMKEAGCRKVYLGLESGNADTLRLMNKQTTVEGGAAAVRRFHEAGIDVAAFFIVGYPGETRASIEETFRFALSLPLDEISFNVPFPLPGSGLYDRVSGIDPEKEWQMENETTFVYQSEFDPRWLRRRINATMRAFANRK
jgi:anaerobic magnesium-protoporphyrin IX monomethyl ester cyclase